MAVGRKQTHRSVASVEMPAHSWAADLGPGLASAGADNDPSGIVTYSVAGAQFGYDMLWALVLSYPSIVALQLISARIAVSTGKGLTANMREHYARPLFYLAVARFVLAITFNIAADIVATGAVAVARLDGTIYSARWHSIAGTSVVRALSKVRACSNGWSPFCLRMLASPWCCTSPRIPLSFAPWYLASLGRRITSPCSSPC
jgi:hypothetical protein